MQFNAIEFNFKLGFHVNFMGGGPRTAVGSPAFPYGALRGGPPRAASRVAEAGRQGLGATPHFLKFGMAHGHGFYEN